MHYQIEAPARILFGRGRAAGAPDLIRPFGPRGLIVHGADASRAAWLIGALPDLALQTTPVKGEPLLSDLTRALATARAHRPDWVLAIGGGAAAVLEAWPQAPMALLCALCSFGGLSIWLQNLLFVPECIRPAKLLCMRMLHGALSGGLALLIFTLFPGLTRPF